VPKLLEDAKKWTNVTCYEQHGSDFDAKRIIAACCLIHISQVTFFFFEVIDVVVHERFSFIYNQFYHPQSVFKIHFSVFADLTLWVNYIGMAEHFWEEAALITQSEPLNGLESVVRSANREIREIVRTVSELTDSNGIFADSFIREVHEAASVSVRYISSAITALYPHLGVKASREDHSINQIFRDYFTATQHHIFTRKTD